MTAIDVKILEHTHLARIAADVAAIRQEVTFFRGVFDAVVKAEVDREMVQLANWIAGVPPADLDWALVRRRHPMLVSVIDLLETQAGAAGAGCGSA